MFEDRPKPAARARTGSSPLLAAVVAVVIGIVATGLAWSRLTPLTRNTGWAEDVTRFIGNELQVGTVQSLFLPYAGYLHFVPRLIAILAVHVTTASHWAQAVTLITCAIVGAVGACVYVLSADIVPSRIARVLLGLVPALVPLAPVEILGNAANIHSYLFYLAPFVFLAGFRTWWRSAILAVIAFAIACTEIQTLAFVPFLALRIHRPRQWPIAAGAIVGWIMQIWTTVHYPRPNTGGEKDSPLDIALGYLIGPFGGTATWHTSRIGTLVADHGWLLLWIPFIVVLAFVVRAFLAGRSGSRLLLIALAWGSIVTWAASVEANDPGGVFAFAHLGADQLRATSPVRYAAVGSMLLLALVVAATAEYLARPGRVHRVIGVVVAVAVVVVFAVNFVVPDTKRAGGPSWSAQIAAAVPACREDPDGSVRIAGAPNPSWATSVSCAAVLRSAG